MQDETGEYQSRVRVSSQFPQRFRVLLHELLHEASRGLARHDFLEAACRAIVEFSGCDVLQLRQIREGRLLRCEGDSSGGGAPRVTHESQGVPRRAEGDALGERIWSAMLSGRLSASPPYWTRSGSLWIGDTARPIVLRNLDDSPDESRSVVIGGEMTSVAFLPVPAEAGSSTILKLGSRRRDFFTPENLLYFEAAAETLGVALTHQETQWALRERVKELTCLYGIARLTQRPDMSQDALLQGAVELLPPGWQYPEITAASIRLHGRSFRTGGFREGPFRQSSPLIVDGEARGQVEVVYTEGRPIADEGPFLKEERDLIDAVAELLGAALTRRRTRWELGERVKELTCLYGIATLAQRPFTPEAELLERIVELLPPAWNCPEAASACIVLDGRRHATPGFRPTAQRQSADITVGGKMRGTVEVVYTRDMPQADEGPFLREERSLIDEVARQVGLIVERREAEGEKARLQEQLRHADRVSTIGQLALGAGHELEGPLGNVLKYAERIRDLPDLSPRAKEDADEIVDAALHSAEVVRKLLVFGRPVPSLRTSVDLNSLVRNGLYLLEARCEREGIRLVSNLAADLPEISADQAQIHQVLVNLVVNSIQAMPAGGVLTIETRRDGEHVVLVVEDTGTGMTDEVLRQIYVPLFTTKELGQGTGLGLSVVRDIVTSHGGTIDAQSEVGKGSRFEVRLRIAPGSVTPTTRR
jgi:signal transduction histidine kinase